MDWSIDPDLASCWEPYSYDDPWMHLVLLRVQKSGGPVEVGSSSRYLQGFIYPRWCRISTINRITFLCVKLPLSTTFWVPLHNCDHPTGRNAQFCNRKCGGGGWFSSNHPRVIYDITSYNFNVFPLQNHNSNLKCFRNRIHCMKRFTLKKKDQWKPKSHVPRKGKRTSKKRLQKSILLEFQESFLCKGKSPLGDNIFGLPPTH